MNGPRIEFFGNLTRDPEKKFSRNDATPYARLRVAVNTYHGTDREPDTSFIGVNVYGSHMESALARAVRGTPVFVAGQLSHQDYLREDGNHDCSLHVQCRDFRVLHRAPSQAQEHYEDPEPPEPAEPGDQEAC